MLSLEGLEDIDSSVIEAINKGLVAKDSMIHAIPYTPRAGTSAKIGKLIKFVGLLKRIVKRFSRCKRDNTDLYPFY